MDVKFPFSFPVPLQDSRWEGAEKALPLVLHRLKFQCQLYSLPLMDAGDLILYTFIFSFVNCECHLIYNGAVKIKCKIIFEHCSRCVMKFYFLLSVR